MKPDYSSFSSLRNLISFRNLVLEKGANVLADVGFNSDGEARVCWYIEVFTRRIAIGFACGILHDTTAASDDFHAFCCLGAKVVFARVDDSEGFGRTVFEGDPVGDDFAVEVDIGESIGGDIFKFHRRRVDGLLAEVNWNVCQYLDCWLGK